MQPSHPLSSPSLTEAERQACDSQSWKARGYYKLGPREGIFHQTVSRLPATNHVFLRSWMVDIHQQGCSRRSALQRGHMAYLRQCFRAHRETECPGPGRWLRCMALLVQCVCLAPGYLSCSDLGRAQNERQTDRDWARTVSKCLLGR